jgi:ribosomal protein S4E
MKYSEDISTEVNYINIIFLRKDGSAARLLLDRKAYITYAKIPREDDSLQMCTVYKIAFRDTDGDGRIGFTDSTEIYVADLDGRNLSPILPENASWEGFAVSKDRQTLKVRASIRPSNSRIKRDDWPQKLFVYDIKTRKLHPYSGIDSTLSVAQQILWGK